MITDRELAKDSLFQVASLMVLAARTAPKTRGIDHLYTAILTEKEIRKLGEIMLKTGQEKDIAFFERDGHNLQSVEVMVLLGTRFEPLNLPECGYCGFTNCDEKRRHPDIPCAFNTGDLGIALGSAVSVAMDHRVDNRIMFTAGKAALQAGLPDKAVKIAYGIPLSAGSKNPFFDRKK
ncbi:MAG: DUF2148 domain-containing protein [Bacteroidales bacterium]